MTQSQSSQQTMICQLVDKDAVWFAANRSHLFRFRFIDKQRKEAILDETPDFYGEYREKPWLLISFRAEDPRQKGKVVIMVFAFPEPDEEALKFVNMPGDAPSAQVKAANNFGMGAISAAAAAGSPEAMLCLEQMLVYKEVEFSSSVIGGTMVAARR